MAIIIHGYQFAVSDQEIFIPYILKSASHSLFPSDALFGQSSASLSLFYPSVGFLTKFFDIQPVFFIGYLIFQFAFFIALYRLARVLLKDNNLAYLSLLPFLLPKFIGGTALLTFDTFFGYRSVGTVFFILYLSFLLEKKFAKSALTALVGAVFHPLSIIPSILLLPVFALYSSKSKLKDSFKYLILPLVAGTLFLILLDRKFIDSLFPLKDGLWLSIIKLRDDYLFISLWSLRAWEALVLYFVLIALFLNKLKSDIKKPVVIISVVCVVVFLMNSLVLEIFKIPSIAQFQLIRSITPVAYVALAMSPLFLTFKGKILKTSGFLLFISLSLNLFYPFLISVISFVVALLIIRNQNQSKPQKISLYIAVLTVVIVYLALNFNSYLVFQNKIQFPKKENDWINVQKWASLNTAKSSLFLVPPTQTGFRIYAARAIVGDIKDGAVVMYSQSYANYWSGLMEDLKNYQNLKKRDFLALKQKYNFDYLITTSGTELDLNTVYGNSSYKIYKI